ncbi:hypothetical protein F5148DRAFT_7258 [Russula earlei]|uniref:Uncharacterized protein n=1 Tax=Russula earlei TaxID=71964 RepID=A0ACC0UQV6_9AGAM|nr:hypothetical protein F5148DRAFT_7258 [Russula earlei]
MSGSVSKIGAERNQKALMELATKPGNDQCADCKTRNPRWASYNLGIFICMNCASIHRKIGTHVTKVKSLTMDVWSKEQVEHMRQTGNVKSNETYNPDEVRHPPPTNMVDMERDSELEKFIRDKYELKRFKRFNRSAIVASHLGPSRSAISSSSSSSFPPSPSRSQTLPPTKASLPSATSAPAAPSRTPTIPAGTTMTRSASQPTSPPAQSPQLPLGSVWSDLASLQGQTRTSTLPLQYLSPTTSPSAPVPMSNSTAGGTNLGPHFAVTSSNVGPASQGPALGSSVSPGANIYSPSVFTGPVQLPAITGMPGVNPFAQMAAQAQAQQNHLLSTSPFGSSLPLQPSFSPQVQQPAFSQSVTNPFFHGVAPSQGAVSPQPHAPFMPTTPSPVPVSGSPYRQPVPSPFQQQVSFQQPAPTPLQPQLPQFGSVQPSSGTVGTNPFTSWLTQPPTSYASAHVGQGSINGQWGSM